MGSIGAVHPMTTPAELWERLSRRGLSQQWPDQQWLVGSDYRLLDWCKLVGDRRRQLEQFVWRSDQSLSVRPLVLIADADPLDFLAGFWAALLADWHVALANPQWGAQERQSVSRLIYPQVVWGQPPERCNEPTLLNLDCAEPAILVPTGGSSGQVKFAFHHWSSLVASVDGFCRYFKAAGGPINGYCVLPLHHVSGLMQVLRAWVSGGQVIIAPFKQLEALPPQLHWSQDWPQDWFISLVPTQLERLMRAGKSAWLSQFQAVLLGGAPAWPALLDRAAAQQIPLCLSYGMTETAAMVTALRPQAFLRGDRSCGPALPHASIHIVQNGQPLPAESIGQIAVSSKALADSPPGEIARKTFYTDDLGYLSLDGRLHITGRASSKIISGGENIFPAEVEAALRSTGQVVDVCVVGLPHPQWGEAVTAAYVPADPSVSEGSLRQAIAQQLSPYKRPKHWISLPVLPRNLQGKINRRALLAQIATLSSEPDLALAGDGDAPEY